MSETTTEQPAPTPEELAAAKAVAAAEAKAAKKAEADRLKAEAKAAQDQADAEAAAAEEAAKAAEGDDPNVGVFVGYGATCHGTENGMYDVDPETGCTTGLIPPDSTQE